jgi:hypothetical protein
MLEIQDFCRAGAMMSGFPPFFACLAARFSLSVIAGFFIGSRLLLRSFDMIFSSPWFGTVWLTGKNYNTPDKTGSM